jgi:hypothetical protein
MKPFTVVTPYGPGPCFEKTLLCLAKSALVERMVVVSQEPVRFKMGRCRVLVAGPLPSIPLNDDHLYRDPDYPWDAYLQS